MDGWFCNRWIILQQAIILSDLQKQVLSKLATTKSPNESCALLFGKIEGTKSVVKEIFQTENTEESPVNFMISNEQLIEAYKVAEQRKMEIVGIFHSHPNSEAHPSNKDKEFMQINPVIWIIFSGITNEFKSFILDGEPVEIPIIIS